MKNLNKIIRVASAKPTAIGGASRKPHHPPNVRIY
jgi:hypothetical protein